MLNIKELILYEDNKELTRYNFDKSINYYYANNSFGKTVMITLLDFMLGKSDFEGKTDGLEGITEAELICSNLFLRRNLISKECKYKRDSDIDYRIINLDIYWLISI